LALKCSKDGREISEVEVPRLVSFQEVIIATEEYISENSRDAI